MDQIRDRLAKLNGRPYLLLDAGDAVKAGNIGVSPFGEPILGRMSDLGYHAMTMGNREFHVWRSALATKIAQARFPVLSANVHARESTATTLPVQPYVKIVLGDLRITVFGLTVPMVTARMKVAPLSAFLFDDPIATARRLITELRGDADVLIALTHIGLSQDRKLAEAVEGIDLIIGGHSHNALSAPVYMNRIPIVQTGSHANLYGEVVLKIENGNVSLESAALCALQGTVK